MVDVNTTLKTDGTGGFNRLSDVGYTDMRTVSAGLGEDEHFSQALHTHNREPQGPDARDVPSSSTINALDRVISR